MAGFLSKAQDFTRFALDGDSKWGSPSDIVPVVWERVSSRSSSRPCKRLRSPQREVCNSSSGRFAQTTTLPCFIAGMRMTSRDSFSCVSCG